MATKRTNGPHSDRTRRPAATTPDARENQLISLSLDEAERLILAGEASSQLLTHFVKLGSKRERLEQELMSERIKLEKAKADNLASIERQEELLEKAISAFAEYRGQPTSEEAEIE